MYAEYARLQLAVDDAKRAVHAAKISGDVNAKFDAERVLWNAQADLEALWQREAADLGLRIRFFRKCFPGRLEELIDPTHRQELDNLGAAVSDLRKRVEEAEGAIVTIAERSGVLSGT
ncbi:MAG: hypothetical protein U0792_00595 [Gemmataceae bacterium]